MNFIKTTKTLFWDKIKELREKLFHKDATVDTNIDVDDIASHIMRLNKDEKEVNNMIRLHTNLKADNKKLAKMSKDESNEFERVINSINNAKLEKDKVKTEIKKLNVKSIPDSFQEGFEETIVEIKLQGEKQRLAKSDMDYLEGEKGYLEYKKEKFEKVLSGLRSMGLMISVLVGISILILSILYVIYDQDIILPVGVLFGVTLFSIVSIFIWKRNITYQLKLNAKKQARAVELLNKAKIKYARYTNFLNYQFNKYNVESLNKLEQMWEQYNIYKINNNQYMELTKYESKVLNGLENIFKKYSITEEEYLFNHCEKIKTKKQRKEMMIESEKLLSKYEEELSYIKEELNNYWQALHMLRNENEDLKLTIDKLIEEKLM